MKKTEVLSELKTLGTEQNRKVYARHGVTGPVFGVSYASLEKLRKKIRRDHALAEQLWATGNHDARILATMIADPDEVSAKLLDAWVRDLDNYVITEAFSGLACQAASAKTRMVKWTAARDEWKGTCGWNILARLAEEDSMSDEELESYLEIIEESIHDAKNRVRYSMNTAVICIGSRPALQKIAIAAARRIGPVAVDHGETGCKTPDAASYIRKVAEYRKKRSKKAAQTKKKSKKKS